MTGTMKALMSRLRQAFGFSGFVQDQASIVAAKKLLKAVDKGGIPLNPARLRKVATDLGLDVSREAKPEDTISRIRAVVGRRR